MMINASAISYQKAGSIPARWLSFGETGCGFDMSLICVRSDDDSGLTYGRTKARGHGKVHVNLSKIPVTIVIEV